MYSHFKLTHLHHLERRKNICCLPASNLRCHFTRVLAGQPFKVMFGARIFSMLNRSCTRMTPRQESVSPLVNHTTSASHVDTPGGHGSRHSGRSIGTKTIDHQYSSVSVNHLIHRRQTNLTSDRSSTCSVLFNYTCIFTGLQWTIV